MPNVIRVTMFKVNKDNIPRFLDLYRAVAKNAVKDSKPYIISLHAGPTEPDARSQGYTLAAKTEFKNLDDMKYYDHECAAHQKLKEDVKGLGVEGVMTVYFTPQVESSL